MHWATPIRSRLFVPSITVALCRAVQLIPFSNCRLPRGTTRLEFVTSGRSVAISVWLLPQSPSSAIASAHPADHPTSASPNAPSICCPYARDHTQRRLGTMLVHETARPAPDAFYSRNSAIFMPRDAFAKNIPAITDPHCPWNQQKCFEEFACFADPILGLATSIGRPPRPLESCFAGAALS